MLAFVLDLAGAWPLDLARRAPHDRTAIAVLVRNLSMASDLLVGRRGIRAHGRVLLLSVGRRRRVARARSCVPSQRAVRSSGAHDSTICALLGAVSSAIASFPAPTGSSPVSSTVQGSVSPSSSPVSIHF